MNVEDIEIFHYTEFIPNDTAPRKLYFTRDLKKNSNVTKRCVKNKKVKTQAWRDVKVVIKIYKGKTISETNIVYLNMKNVKKIWYFLHCINNNYN